MPKRQLELLGTSGCHLCDEAQALLVQCLDFDQVEVTLVDIADSDELVQLYGIKIPVLRCGESNNVLCWPFDSVAVSCF
jgi:hypothetical protein